MDQIEKVYKIIKFKYNPIMHTIVWLFDQSSCHRAFPPGALNVNSMSVKPGEQSVMHDTMWAGRKQTMLDAAGVPKGMKRVLEERGQQH